MTLQAARSSNSSSRSSTVVAMILTQLVLLLLQFKSTESTEKDIIALPGCQERCGGILIPYPFGIGRNCSLSEQFNVTCKTFNNGTSIPYSYLHEVEILNIDHTLGQGRIISPISSRCYNTTTKQDDFLNWGMEFHDIPFWINTEKNKFIVTGCNTLAYLCLNIDSSDINKGWCNASSIHYSVGCLSSCDSRETLIEHGSSSCSGIGCCQTAIPKGTSSFLISFDDRINRSEVYNFNRCSFAMLVEETKFNFTTAYVTNDELLNNPTLPMVINWAIGNGNTTCEHAQTDKSTYACTSSNSNCTTVSGRGYLCSCSHGYEGNPYLQGGCKDIDECNTKNPCSRLGGKCHNLPGTYQCSCHFGWHSKHGGICQLNVDLVIGTVAGIFGLSFLGFVTYVVLERRKLCEVQKKYFQQHGGWILLEKIKSNQGFGFTIFTKQQVEQATNNFDNANIIGHGGQGTVYKGTIRDQTVAVKKCKIVDESKTKEFGKEMLILSQINHKNIVKILGCCLEVEVPMLVYEFISNGTLDHHIHYKKKGSHISLDIRLRIAHESAEALAYLHTSASPPIFHGDVKSANILLDQNFTAKVSDFGASILAPTDEAQLVTFVQGTCGYLDPEYMQSCQLTDKSDVYSFGVVLLELLTSKPVIDFDVPEEERGLSSRFLSAMKEKKMHELLDNQIMCEDDMKLITEVAELAKQCLNIKGEDRPTMKEVSEELNRIRKSYQHPWRQEYLHQDRETLLEEAFHSIKIEHTPSFSQEKKAEKSIAAR